MVSEKTPLTEQTSTNYTFQAGVPSHIKLKRRFQCCWGAFILALVVCVLVIVVSYMVAGVNDNPEIAEAIQSQLQAPKKFTMQHDIWHINEATTKIIL
ncbi:hypothetical protein CBL_14221 [Carabus blaptoides fortunei]